MPGRLHDGSDRQALPDVSVGYASDRAKGEYFLGPRQMPQQYTYDMKPGSMSVDVSEASYDGRSELNDSPEKNRSQSKSAQSLRPKRSSPVLGERQARIIASPPASGPIWSVPQQASSPTLRSHYEAQRSFPLISQPPPASSTRDMAPRKGISTSAMAATSPVVKSQCQAREQIVSKDHAKPQDKTKRPSRLDISRLFPRTKGNGENLLSPSQLAFSPSPLASKPEYTSSPISTSGKGGRWGLRSKKSKESIKTTMSQSTQSTVSRSIGPEKYDSPKLNVKRPPRGIQHWFEGIDVDEEDDEEAEEKPGFDPSQSFDPNRRLAKVPNAVCKPSRDPRLQTMNRAKSSLAREQSDVVDFAHRPPASRVRGPVATSPNERKENGMSQTNLHNHSVLSLSSDEDETDVPDSRTKPIHNKDGDTTGATIRSTSRTTVFPIQHPVRKHVSPRKETDSLRHSGLTSGSIPIAPPNYQHMHHLPLPEQNRHQKDDHKSYQSQSSSVLNEEDPTRNSSNSSDPFGSRSSTPTRPASPTTTITTVSTEAKRRESSRMMEVTKEEEALLAMMRRKRAAMAKSSFSEGYRQALAEEQALLEEEAAERKRQTLLAMQARQREREYVPRSRGHSRTSQASSAYVDSPTSVNFPGIPELMDASSSSPDTRRNNREPPSPHSSSQSTPTPQIPIRSSSRSYSNLTNAHSSSSTLKQPPLPPPPSSSSSQRPGDDSRPLASVTIASPYLHLFPSPGSRPIETNPMDALLESSSNSTSPSATHSHATASTIDSPLTPDHDVDIKPSSSQQVKAFESRNASRSSDILPIFAQSPPPSTKERKMAHSQKQPHSKEKARGAGDRRERTKPKSRKDIVSVLSTESAHSLSSVQTLGSVQSRNSVGADVLAAWGALGGWSQDERVKLGQF
ncbi:MAG: hypothetical protein Q9165_000591 [Trypethelium subeluteriae]